MAFAFNSLTQLLAHLLKFNLNENFFFLKITSAPWLRIDSIPNNQKLFGFTNILRLELLDELIKTPFYNPLNYSTEEIIYKKDEEEKTVLEQWLDRNRLKRAMKFVEKV